LIVEVAGMSCSVCGIPHTSMAACQTLRQLRLSINLFAVPAFLTDPLNRFVYVNPTFARMIGDPVRDRLTSEMRFLGAALLGPYRDRFPRGRIEVAQCAAGIFREVEAGRLSPGTARLMEATLAQDDGLKRMAWRNETPWDGTLVIRDHDDKLSMVLEQVVAVAGPQGGDSGYHLSLWLPVDKSPPPLPAQQVGGPTGVASLLTARQLEVARWYSTGLTGREVAAEAGISPKTARDHLEEIYLRLDVHSRAELIYLLVRESLV
jgi:DNA-binding CsgD family transcriptional regulator